MKLLGCLLPALMILTSQGITQENPTNSAATATAPVRDTKKARQIFRNGLAYQDHHDLTNAMAKWDEALRVDPDLAPCLNHYAWFLAADAPSEIRDPKRALEMARRAVQVTSGNEPDYLDTLAEVHHQMKENTKAVMIMENLLKKFGNQLREGKKKYYEGQLNKFQKALQASGS